MASITKEMKLRGKINEDGSVHLTDNQRVYLMKNAGKYVTIEIDQRTNVEKIRFIEGAITPYYFYQHNIGVFRDFRDARHSLKKIAGIMSWFYNAEGKREDVVDSMTKVYSSKKKTQAFIDFCQKYFGENGYEFPDSAAYLKWVESAPPPGAVYPPLQKLIDEYKKFSTDKGK